MRKTSIILEPHTADELKRYGRKEQTYDDIINELLKRAKGSSNAATLDDFEGRI